MIFREIHLDRNYEQLPSPSFSDSVHCVTNAAAYCMVSILPLGFSNHYPPHLPCLTCSLSSQTFLHTACKFPRYFVHPTVCFACRMREYFRLEYSPKNPVRRKAPMRRFSKRAAGSSAPAPDVVSSDVVSSAGGAASGASPDKNCRGSRASGGCPVGGQGSKVQASSSPAALKTAAGGCAGRPTKAPVKISLPVWSRCGGRASKNLALALQSRECVGLLNKVNDNDLIGFMLSYFARHSCDAIFRGLLACLMGV